MDGYRILCIDDDIMTLNTLEDILSDAGFQVSLAKSGAHALRLLQRGITCNLILLDVEMPEMDGYETLVRIRETEAFSRIPVIFLTGMGAPEYEVRGLEYGAEDYIVKPFIKNVLIARIRNQLRKTETASEKQNSLNPKSVELMQKELNDSEMLIAGYIAEGLTNQEIADRTHYSYNYVKKMTSSILGKLELTRRSEIRRMLKE